MPKRNYSSEGLTMGRKLRIAQLRQRRPALSIDDHAGLVAWLEQNRRIDEGSGCWLWTGPTSGKGYGSVHITGLKRRVYVHRLSAHLFQDFDLASPLLVLHRCDVPQCFNPDHLFLGTARDNIQDCIDKGRFTLDGHARGEAVNTAKLTEDDVRAIRREAAEGVARRALAERYGVTFESIGNIVRRKTWRHVADEA